MTTAEYITHYKNLHLHLASISKQLGEILGTPQSQIYKEVIKNEEDYDLINSVVAQQNTIHKLYSRPKAGRPVRNCFQNAKQEERETGNERVWGYMYVATRGHLQHTFVHCFNVDKEGNYYDTQNYREAKEIVGMVSISTESVLYAYLTELYDYIYIKTQDRVFRWKKTFGTDDGKYTLDKEIV
jgi:hypothetical protein